MIPNLPKRSTPVPLPKHSRTDHHEIEVSQSDVLAAIPDSLGAMDLPTMDGIIRETRPRDCRLLG